MNEATLNEAEIQVLAPLHQAEDENASSDRTVLEESGGRFWLFREDWADAFPSLLAKGLIEGNDSDYRLSEFKSARAVIRVLHRPVTELRNRVYDTTPPSIINWLRASILASIRANSR